MSGYILSYTKTNTFYKYNIINTLIKKGVTKSKLLVFDDNFSTINNKTEIKTVKVIMEIDCPEYYKCIYSDDITLYFNEYNMIICSKFLLSEKDLNKILRKPKFIFIV